MTAEGRLLLCLGQENSIDMRALVRRHPTTDAPLLVALRKSLQGKPAHHDFSSDGEVQIVRFMNATGG
jgi:cyclic pyranopterin phosphate synthase